jgi:hypothetical protein
MTCDEYRRVLARMNLRQVDVSWIMNVTGRQGQRWANGTSPVPQAVSLILLALEQGHISALWLRKHIDAAIPYSHHSWKGGSRWGADDA